MSTITISDAQRAALSLVAIDPVGWAINAIAARADAALTEASQSEEWPGVLAAAAAAGVNVADRSAVLMFGITAGTLETAAARQTKAEAVQAAAVDAAPVAGPGTITDMQLIGALAERKLISEAEALAWISAGALPKSATAFIAALPDAARFPAKMLLTGATTFNVGNATVDAYLAHVGEADAAAFWSLCRSL